MIDTRSKRKTIKLSDISPQEEWWEKNLLEAYTEIETLQQQRDDLLAALNKYGDHEPCCMLGDACNCGFEAAIEKA